MKTISITCKTCGKITKKLQSEINRQKKRGRENFYCSLKCAGKNNKNIKRLEKYHNHFKQNKYVRQSDEYSSFKWYMKIVIKNSKKRNHEYNIDVKYLKELWDKQNGFCSTTGQKIILRTHTNNNIKKHPYQASLDRIDSSKGYIKGNVRFVALIYNYAKNIFSDDEVIAFCKAVAEYN